MVHCFSVAHFLENKGTGKKEKEQCLGAISVLSHIGHSCNPLFSCFYLFGWFPSSYCCTKMSPLVLNFCFNVRITCRLVSEKSFHKVDTVKHKNICCRTCAEKKPPHWENETKGWTVQARCWQIPWMQAPCRLNRDAWKEKAMGGKFHFQCFSCLTPFL